MEDKHQGRLSCRSVHKGHINIWLMFSECGGSDSSFPANRVELVEPEMLQEHEDTVKHLPLINKVLIF